MMRRLNRSSLLVLVLSIALLGLIEAQFHLGRRLIGTPALGQRELATLFLGQHLAQRFPGQMAVVWSNPFSRESGQPREVYQFEKAGLPPLRSRPWCFPNCARNAAKIFPRSTSIQPRQRL
jgi:hypothetical protein